MFGGHGGTRRARSTVSRRFNLKGSNIMKVIFLVLASLLCATQVGAQIEKQKVNPAPAKAKKEVKSETKQDAGQSARTPEQKFAAYREFFQAQQYESENNYIQAVESYKKVI